MNQPAYESFDQMGRIPKILKYIIVSFLPVAGVVAFLIGVYIFYASIAYDGYTVWAALALSLPAGICAVEMLTVGWSLISEGLAHYRFEETGLWVKYPFCKPVLIPWEEFQQVCVLYKRIAYRRNPPKPSLCCVKKGEKLDGYRRWKTDSLLHYRSVITIEYTPELHQGLIERCTQDVVDLRETMNYKPRYKQR